ncbi:MAG: PhzF family phenazine biosynthesis protein [Clostridia bacterium]|nr:PhzF family phenazine biosynthesis protein [Clostridia bacterium]
MRNLRYYFVDVFAEKPYSGNQLAVFPDAGSLSSEEMQAIAREVNFSETTFILNQDHQASRYRVRIFTPQYEVPFAGHPTLGTAYIIRNRLQTVPTDSLTLVYEAGDIPVSVGTTPEHKEIYWMKQLEPEFREVLPADSLADVLGLAPSDLNAAFPVQQVSTGLAHIIVPVKNHKALAAIKVSKEKYFSLIEKTWAKNIQVFCPGTHDGQDGISTRMFTDYLGIPEDPATGSGNGCLAGYLVKHRFFGGASVELRSEQGYEMGRPSVLFLKAAQAGESIKIEVGGGVVPVAEGLFY